MRYLILTITFVISACASDDSRFGSDPGSIWQRTDLPAAAYAVRNFYLDKPMKKRPPAQGDFFYKHCFSDNEGDYQSKRSYWCNENP